MKYNKLHIEWISWKNGHGIIFLYFVVVTLTRLFHIVVRFIHIPQGWFTHIGKNKHDYPGANGVTLAWRIWLQLDKTKHDKHTNIKCTLTFDGVGYWNLATDNGMNNIRDTVYNANTSGFQRDPP